MKLFTYPSKIDELIKLDRKTNHRMMEKAGYIT